MLGDKLLELEVVSVTIGLDGDAGELTDDVGSVLIPVWTSKFGWNVDDIGATGSSAVGNS